VNTTRTVNSVNSLVVLYTVVVGAALSIAVSGVIDPKQGLGSVTLPPALLFIAFVATLFPFVHGALRHLNDAYVDNEGSHIRQGALIVDFALLFLHALTFVVLALLIKRPGDFAWCLSVLLTIDVAWGLFAHFGSSARHTLAPEAKWAIINFVFVAVIVTYLVQSDIYLQEISSPLKVAVPTVFACVLRSVADYIWCKEFYFPK
jgi:hypothetical protein